jgi:hypothetical protein
MQALVTHVPGARPNFMEAALANPNAEIIPIRRRQPRHTGG